MNNVKSILTLTALTVALALGSSPMVLAADDPADSGFLPDYSKLKDDPDYPGSKKWVAAVKFGKYTAIIIDPVVTHLSPGLIKDGAKPDAALLNQVTDYLRQALIREFGAKKSMHVVDKPAENAVRYRAAITGVSASSSMGGPAGFLPAVLILRTATGANDKKAHIHMESIYTDSVTGEVVAEVLQGATGDSVSGDTLTLDNVKGGLDKWAKKAADVFVAARGK